MDNVLTKRFGDLYLLPSSNGLSRPAAVRGSGFKMINMGELFANNIITALDMERVQMSETEQKKFFLEEGDLLFARQSLVAEGAGKCSIVKTLSEPTTFESHIIRVRLNKTLGNPWYYYYLFQMKSNPIKTIVNQCAQAGIRGSELIKIKVPNPSILIQQKIANILSRYDEAIENNNKRIKLLEQMAQNLYKEWFVRFRFPGYENCEFENGIPVGWKISRVGEYVKIKSGFAFKSEWWQDEGCPVVKIKDITDGKVDITELDCVSEEHTKKAKSFLLKEGDLVIAMTGATIGKIGIVPKIENLFTNQRVGKFFLGDEPFLRMPFLYCLFSQNSTLETVYCLSGASSAQPNISPEQLESIKFINTDDIIDKFNKKTVPIFKMILKLRENNQNLIQQRDLLLPRLMSGKLEVD